MRSYRTWFAAGLLAGACAFFAGPVDTPGQPADDSDATKEEEPATPIGSVVIVGAVVSPGEVALFRDPPFHLSDLIEMAGGFTPDADTSSIRIYRHDPNKMLDREIIDVSALKTSRGYEFIIDIVLHARDIIVVPVRPAQPGEQAIGLDDPVPL